MEIPVEMVCLQKVAGGKNLRPPKHICIPSRRMYIHIYIYRYMCIYLCGQAFTSLARAFVLECTYVVSMGNIQLALEP